MKKKRVLALLGALAVLSSVAVGGTVMASAEDTPQEIVLEKSNSGNPMLGFDENGNVLYGGDPSILVDGDTVYCYVGNDASDGEYYWMPNWRCYSTTDMKTWKYESTIMTMQDIPWRNDDVSAWASQVAKGSDGKYYFYFCAEGNASVGGGKCIGVAVSDSPTGPFKCTNEPLVRNTDTPNGPHTWEEIDPTIWIETDENDEEHRYLGWGNNRFFVCELNKDMTSIKDRDGDPNTLSVGYYYEGATPNDIVIGQMDGMEIFNDQDKFSGHCFTEAPYYYRQQDENGNYYGPYYMFFASDWREQMAYATTDDIMTNSWKFGGIIMEPSATANTNHMAVFDFKGHTYFVYHDGSLPHGSGFRRVACIEEITINEDGTIDPITKTAVGLTGTVSTIADYTGAFVASETFENTLSDSQYPMTDWSTPSLAARGSKNVLMNFFTTGAEKEWEINPGKADEAEDAYVSIESNYKPGLYLAAADGTGDTIDVVLAQDAGGTAQEARRMTFRTLTGLVGKGVTFESVLHPGYYLVSRNGDLLLAKAETVSKEEATFFVSTEAAADSYSPATVLKTTRLYPAGSTLNTDDIRITVQNGSGQYTVVEEYTTNVAEIDMSTVGEKTLTVTYECGGERYQAEVTITVVDADYRS